MQSLEVIQAALGNVTLKTALQAELYGLYEGVVGIVQGF